MIASHVPRMCPVQGGRAEGSTERLIRPTRPVYRGPDTGRSTVKRPLTSECLGGNCPVTIISSGLAEIGLEAVRTALINHRSVLCAGVFLGRVVMVTPKIRHIYWIVYLFGFTQEVSYDIYESLLIVRYFRGGVLIFLDILFGFALK
jgi:hypothetical protein